MTICLPSRKEKYLSHLHSHLSNKSDAPIGSLLQVDARAQFIQRELKAWHGIILRRGLCFPYRTGHKRRPFAEDARGLHLQHRLSIKTILPDVLQCRIRSANLDLARLTSIYPALVRSVSVNLVFLMRNKETGRGHKPCKSRSCSTDVNLSCSRLFGVS